MQSGTAARVAATIVIGGAVGLLAAGVSGAFEASGPETEGTPSATAPAPLDRGAATNAAAVPDGIARTAVVEVWKSPTCRCCTGWVEHMRERGFTVAVHEVEDPGELAAMKAGLGVAPEMAACHTARVGETVIEGHVPADAVRRFLAAETGERGLAVPGMPIGSPGMEVPGRSADDYEVLAFSDDGSTRVFEER